MNNIAQFPPYDYYLKLLNVDVPGYQNGRGGLVSISEYVSANKMFGGNTKSEFLAKEIRRIVKNKPESALLKSAGLSLVFSGQGSIENFSIALSIIAKYPAEFKKIPELAECFKPTDYLQEMLDKAWLGLDCVGFVGNYLVEAGVETSYPPRVPLGYAPQYSPVQTLDQIQPLAMVMHTSGLHIQIIDTVNERGKGFIKVDLCQSSGGGPQCNVGVTIKSGGGNFLPVEEFRAVNIESKPLAKDQEEYNATRKSEGKKELDYESYLRARFTKPNTMTGYMGGAIFQLGADGREPLNPMPGSVYIGVPKAGLSVRTPASAN